MIVELCREGGTDGLIVDSRNILGGRNVVGDLVCPWPWRCYDAVHYDAAHARLG